MEWLVILFLSDLVIQKEMVTFKDPNRNSRGIKVYYSSALSQLNSRAVIMSELEALERRYITFPFTCSGSLLDRYTLIQEPPGHLEF